MGNALIALFGAIIGVSFLVWLVKWQVAHVRSLLRGRRMTIEHQTARFIALLDGRDDVYISMYEMKIPKRVYTEIATQHGYRWVGWARQWLYLGFMPCPDPALRFTRSELVRSNWKRSTRIYHKADRLLPSACHRRQSKPVSAPPKNESFLQYTTTDVSRGSLR